MTANKAATLFRRRKPAAAAVLWLGAFTAATALLAPGSFAGRVLGDGLPILPTMLAVTLSARAARRGTRRAFWLLLALAGVLAGVGQVLWLVRHLALGQQLGFPTATDPFYIASYALAIPTLLVGVSRTRPIVTRVGLDVAIVSTVVGLIGWEYMIKPDIAFLSYPAAKLAVLTGIVYTLIGLVVVALLIALAVAEQLPRSPAVALVAAGLCLMALTNVAYLYLYGLKGWIPPQFLNIGYQTDAILVALAALSQLREQPGRRYGLVVFGRDPARVVTFGSALLANAIAVADGFDGKIGRPMLLMVVCLDVGAMVRFYLGTREKALQLKAALVEQERLAITDSLTVLHNRRFFEDVFGGALQQREPASLGVLMIDVDRFKRVNDECGHAVGDAVLREIAHRLRGCMRAGDILARYGGEEFIVGARVEDSHELAALGERCRRAIESRPIDAGGVTLQSSVSVGGAHVSDHAQTLDDLVTLADRALYRAKGRGRNRVEVGFGLAVASDQPVVDDDSALGLLERLADQLDEHQYHGRHSFLMERTVDRLALALGLGSAARWRCTVAARLHDVGKLLVAPAVLTAARPLTQDEWEAVRRHPLEGARLLELSPRLREVAPIVRDHHERLDGRGYPRARSGDEIGIEARIVAVCDAWSAMRSDRAYRSALPRESAVAQLSEGSGTQFDPDVVRTFLELEAAGELDEIETLSVVNCVA